MFNLSLLQFSTVTVDNLSGLIFVYNHCLFCDFPWYRKQLRPWYMRAWQGLNWRESRTKPMNTWIGSKPSTILVSSPDQRWGDRLFYLGIPNFSLLVSQKLYSNIIAYLLFRIDRVQRLCCKNSCVFSVLSSVLVFTAWTVLTLESNQTL